ncbi:MAG: hypothetical protein RLZZ352_1459 [Pseudomonadota bacterium]|jgi:uncharacterized protein involved in exopolysaccharide biosynthesis
MTETTNTISTQLPVNAAEPEKAPFAESLSAASQTPDAPPPGGLEQEVDLLEYLNAVLKRKYSMTALAFLGAVMMFALTFLQDNIYYATAVMAINIDEKPGGVAPKEYRSSDTIGLLERDFVINSAALNERDRLMARMRSARFSEIFIRDNNLLPYLFHKQWDDKNRRWKEDFVPDIREAIKSFGEIRGVEYDEKTGLLLISFSTRDPALSAELANKFALQFNRYAKNIALDELAERRNYLESRLRINQNLELQRSIFRLLETQLAAETLINARSTFPLEEIQPAVPPLVKIKPKRLFTAALTFIGLMFLGVTVVIGSVLLGKISKGLQKLSGAQKPDSDDSASTKKSYLQRLSWRKNKKLDEDHDWIDD